MRTYESVTDVVAHRLSAGERLRWLRQGVEEDDLCTPYSSASSLAVTTAVELTLVLPRQAEQSQEWDKTELSLWVAAQAESLALKS